MYPLKDKMGSKQLMGVIFPGPGQSWFLKKFNLFLVYDKQGYMNYEATVQLKEKKKQIK